jgi:hypothetical protein
MQMCVAGAAVAAHLLLVLVLLPYCGCTADHTTY